MNLTPLRIMLFGAFILTGSVAGAAPRSINPLLAKLPGESDERFAVRALRLGDADVHLLAATWNGVHTLFVDYERGADTESPERPLLALRQVTPGKFRRVQVTVGETEGGEPDVAAIGFANADRDPAKELIVILAWRQPHGGGACGPIYEVRIFDDPGPGEAALRALPISKHFGLGCAERPERFRFTTIAAVKAKLGRLGY